MDAEFYMRRALELARRAFEMGEVPVGAVIVRRSTGEIIGEGYNRRETSKHALAHAELMAIDEACRKLGGWRLPDCAMFVTLEPCPMCSGAIIQARIDELYFGASDPKSGAVCSVQQMFELPYNYHPIVTRDILKSECSQILSDFFRELRLKKLERLKKSQEQTKFQNQKRALMQEIGNFHEKYRFATDSEIEKIEKFISRLHFTFPAHIALRENVPEMHNEMYLCFLCGTEELLKLYLYGNYQDFMLDVEDWQCFSPYLLLIDEDFVRYIYINDDGERKESKAEYSN